MNLSCVKGIISTLFLCLRYAVFSIVKTREINARRFSRCYRIFSCQSAENRSRKLQSSLDSIIMIELSLKVSTCTMITLGREVDVEHAIYGKACKSIKAGFLSFNIFCSCARSKYISQSSGARGCPQRRIWCVLKYLKL